jgi:hypothetical protein
MTVASMRTALARKRGLALGLADHHAGQLVDNLGTQPAHQLADRGLVRHPLGQCN